LIRNVRSITGVARILRERGHDVRT